MSGLHDVKPLSRSLPYFLASVWIKDGFSSYKNMSRLQPDMFFLTIFSAASSKLLRPHLKSYLPPGILLFENIFIMVNTIIVNYFFFYYIDYLDKPLALLTGVSSASIPLVFQLSCSIYLES